MSRGIFSGDFSGVFADRLVEKFGDEFPSHFEVLPDPESVAVAPDVPEPEAGPPDDVPGGQPEIDLPLEAAAEAAQHVPFGGESVTQSAVFTDFGSLFTHAGNHGGGSDGGGGGGGKPGGGGGKPGGNGGGNTIYDDFVIGATTGTDPMNIEIELYGGAEFWESATGTALIGYLQASADFLTSIITQGFTDDPAMFNSYDTGTPILVDDLLIEVYVEGFKGRNSNTIAAETQIFAANDFNGVGLPETPAGATMTFNLNLIDSLESLGVLDDTVLHEMLHTLGFGLWETADNDLTSTSSGVITYTGDGALGAIVENEGLTGSVGGHWAEATYDQELMTSIVETTDTMYLADFSIASLQDLAVVNHDGSTGYQLADDWQAQVAALNGAATGIDLDAWVLSLA